MSYTVREQWTGVMHTFNTLEEADAYCDTHFLPKPRRPMPEYTPLMVTPIASRNKPGQVVAFIEKQLCFFETQMQNPLTEQYFEVATPEIGKPIEVMITRPIHRRHPDGHEYAGYRNYNSLSFLLITPVEPYYEAVYHDGFECSGSMCSTTASIIDPRDPKYRGGILTPGRTNVYEADNVNAGTTWKQKYAPLRPGKVFVWKGDGKRRGTRAEGLADWRDGEYAHAVKR